MENNNNQIKENEEDIKLEKITDNDASYKYMFRICFIGNAYVGKTSLLSRYTDSNFKLNYKPTIGVDFQVITLKYKDIVAKVHIWDTAGQERFISVASNYYRSCNGFIYVYEITNRDSFNKLDFWINLTHENCDSNVINFLVGNKSDLEDKREVTKEEAQNFAQKYNLIFLETSAKNNNNVDKLFEYFTYKLIDYYEKNKEKYLWNDNDSNSVKFKDLDSNEETEKKCSC
jgi:small GTP-binding protein